MANSVTKEQVKAFVRDVRIELDRRYAARFASNSTFNSTLNSVKDDLGTLEDEVANIDDKFDGKYVEQVDGKVLSSNDFTDADKQLLERLAAESNSAFDASDVADIFND